jgi:hypothetical protein
MNVLYIQLCGMRLMTILFDIVGTGCNANELCALAVTEVLFILFDSVLCHCLKYCTVYPMSNA